MRERRRAPVLGGGVRGDALPDQGVAWVAPSSTASIAGAFIYLVDEVHAAQVCVFFDHGAHRTADGGDIETGLSGRSSRRGRR